jgi:hypothetical protein
MAESDTVSGVGFLLEMIAGRRLWQVCIRSLHAPITTSAVEDHPKRCRGALHQDHEKHQHRLQQELFGPAGSPLRMRRFVHLPTGAAYGRNCARRFGATVSLKSFGEVSEIVREDF